MDKILMKCGHNSSTMINGKPVCVICYGIKKEAEEIADSIPILNGRKAKCCYCGQETNSDVTLPFFRYEPKKTTDTYCCGCKGWD